MRPSYTDGIIARMNPGIKVVDEDVYDNPIHRITSPANGFPYLINGINHLPDKEPDGGWKELYRWYYNDPTYREKLAKLAEAAFLSQTQEGLGKEVARALYGNILNNSVSRLEQFAACAFSHFLMYGLKLLPREEYVFQPVDMGNIFHKVIEEFSKKVEDGPYTWFDIPREVQEEWISECVVQATKDYGQEILSSNARNAYVVERINRIMKRTVWALCEQIKAGEFIPSNYEVSFSMAEDLEAVNISLTAEEKMKLKGRIDRIDTCEKEEEVYVKVIDYKSGNTEFDMVALYYGLQLQLVVYLNADGELEKKIHPDKKVVPAGVFYYRMQDPMLDRELDADPQRIEGEILKKLKLNGLVNEDAKIINSMDKGGAKSSSVIPVSYNKDGSLSRYSTAAAREQFDKLSVYVNDKMRDIGSRILKGETEVKPYQRKGKTACDYCTYREVCGFDTRIPGMGYQRLREYKTEEVWKKIGEDM